MHSGIEQQHEITLEYVPGQELGNFFQYPKELGPTTRISIRSTDGPKPGAAEAWSHHTVVGVQEVKLH